MYRLYDESHIVPRVEVAQLSSNFGLCTRSIASKPLPKRARLEHAAPLKVATQPSQRV